MTRIKLRALEKQDQSCTEEMLSDIEVMKYIGSGNAFTPREATQWFYNEFENPSRFVVADKISNELIGFCGIKTVGEIADFAYFIRKKFWGNGYATEACIMTIANLKHSVDFSKVQVFIAAKNCKSLAIASKLGWQKLNTVTETGEHGTYFRVCT